VLKSRAPIDRRSLITGRVLTAERVIAPPQAEIASVIVQLRPEHLVDVEAAILGLPGCEVHARDDRGKLVVVVDAIDAGALGSTLNAIALLPNVYSASLVFHAIDTAPGAGRTS
jgi:periplasmic nitrate reductase NapD